MNIRKRMVGDVAVVALSGALDSHSADAVRDRITDLLPQHHHVADVRARTQGSDERAHATYGS